ncbi:MAG: aminotransferase class V-fold PLP-dependent enzyme [Cyanobacteria bacterium P01_H01_bin.130]
MQGIARATGGMGMEDWTAEDWAIARRELPLAMAVFEKVRSLRARFHVPGHQGMGFDPLGDRWGSAFLDDLTELEGLDNLAVPSGAIAEAQALAAQTFGADQSWFLVNGSTVGLQAALLAVSRINPSDRQKIVIGRNAHQSILTGLVLSGLQPVWVQPEINDVWAIATHITPEAIAQALDANPDACAVCIVSPTYYGTTSDVRAIARLCHRRGIPLIVDEAHGGHFMAHPDLPQPALAEGADIVIQSAHKTLGSLTQSAFLHWQGSADSLKNLKTSLGDSLRLLQSSSPSYLLMTSLDVARSQLQRHGYQDWQRALNLARDLCDRLDQMPKFTGLQHRYQDLTRVVISGAALGWSGYALDEYLDRHGIAVEIGDPGAIGLVITPQTQPDAIQMLVQTLQSLPPAPDPPDVLTLQPQYLSAFSETVLTPREAWFSPKQAAALDDAMGEVCAEWICPYPPGIPVLMPGEKITTDALDYLKTIRAIGGELSGVSDPEFRMIQVIKTL